MWKKAILILFLFPTLLGCLPFKQELYRGNKGKEYARKNIMIDMANTYKTSKYHIKEYGKSFNVFMFYSDSLIDNKVYGFHIVPNYNDFTLRTSDKIGEVPKSGFPNNYEVVNNKLFLWRDTVTPLKKNILKIMDEYGVLDSVLLKRRMGLLPKNFKDERMFIMDHSVHGYFYFVCKDNIEHYKKIRTDKMKGYYNVPNMGCNKD